MKNGQQEAQHMLRYSATCEPLDACHRSAKLFKFHIPHWDSSVEIGITGYYDLGRLRHAGSQDTDLFCHVSISSFCCTMWSQSTNVTESRAKNERK